MSQAGEPLTPPWLVVTTVGQLDEARALARALVELRLAACAQIEPIESLYRWQGAVEQASEVRVLFKIRPELYEQVEAAIRERHPYELPAIHAIASDRAEPAYARWVAESTLRPPDPA